MLNQQVRQRVITAENFMARTVACYRSGMNVYELHDHRRRSYTNTISAVRRPGISVNFSRERNTQQADNLLDTHRLYFLGLHHFARFYMAQRVYLGSIIKFTGLVITALALCGPGAIAQAAGETTSNPVNIILIVADDMDYAGIGATGGNDTQTTNIDSIAKNGALFTQAYVTAPVCGPSRVGILTGRYQDRVGFLTNDGPHIPETFGLPSSEVLIPEMLKRAGYTSGMVGKWHLGFKPDMVPNAQGFDYFYGHLLGAHNYFPDNARPAHIFRNRERVSPTKYLTTVFGEEAAQFIRENKENPYFLYVPFNAVHAPWQAPKGTIKQFAHIEDKLDRTMAAMLYEMDQSVGTILGAVRNNNAEENTLIVFTNDNGGIRGHLPYTNAGMRGGKMDLYEGGIRTPLLMQWKGKIKAGQRFDKVVSTLDLAPTFLAAANTTTTVELDGVNLLPYLSGEKSGAPHEILYWRLIDAPNEKAIRKGDWKAIKPAPEMPWELYNIAVDIRESKNLASEKPELLKQLRDAWNAWNKNNKGPLFMDKRISVRRQERRKQLEAKDALTTPTS